MRQRMIWGGGIALVVLLLFAVYFLFLRAPAVQVAAPTRGMAVEAVAPQARSADFLCQVSTKTGWPEVVAQRARPWRRECPSVIDAKSRCRNARLHLAALSAPARCCSGRISAAVRPWRRRMPPRGAGGRRGRRALHHRPIAGTVLRSENQLKIGDMAQPGQVLFLVGDAAALQIDAEVDEEDILKVEMGQDALIRADAFAGRVLEGTVSGITPHGDPVARTYRVYIALPDDTPLVSGMTTEINIVVRREENALLVPLSAIVGGAVWVVEGGRVQLRPVTLGAVGNTEAEILSGLSDDDTIVVNPAAGISEGGRVRPNADRE